MSYFGRLPPEYRRRAVINGAMTVAVVLALANFWRLGPTNGPRVLVVLMALVPFYMSGYAGYQLARADPRPGIAAYVLYGVWTASLVLTVICGALNIPGASILVFVYFMLLLTFFIAYRRIVFPRVGERYRAVRAAQRAERAERAARLTPDHLREMFGRQDDKRDR